MTAVRVDDLEDPVTSPVLVGPLVGTGAGATADPMPERVPLTTLLVGREEGRRDALVQAFGGSAETELAVARSLAWLAKQQRSDGLWSLKGPYRDGSGWHIIPVRVTASDKAEVTIVRPSVVVE